MIQQEFQVAIAMDILQVSQ